MANEKQDEEYLETLLNSIINGEDDSNPLPENTADEKNEVKAEHEEEEKAEISAESETEELTEFQKKLEEENTEVYESESENKSESSAGEPEMGEEKFNQWLEDEMKKEDLSNDINIDDVIGDESDGIDEIINSMYSEEDAASENDRLKQNKDSDKDVRLKQNESADETLNQDKYSGIDDDIGSVNSLTDIDNLINHDIKGTEDKKENAKTKKESFFKKIFAKKEKHVGGEENINANEILRETGSTAQDMSDFGLLNEMELYGELDDMESRDKKKDKKKKKTKKVNKKSKKKEQNIKRSREKEFKRKQKKEEKIKPLIKEEIIRISPISVVFMITVIVVVVLGVYLGAGTFSYKSKINQASSYYVDKEYTKAYDVLAGMNLKSEDKNFYNQIVNIMKVEKHVNDFRSYMEIKYYARALEALLRGIEEYDANIGVSNELGTTEILKSILNDIDTALQNYYGMTVEEARTIIQIGNKAEIAKIINEKSGSVMAENN